MASNMRLLLHLPPVLRQQLYSLHRIPSSCIISRHGITNSSKPLSISAHLSKQSGKNKTSYKNAQPQTPTPQARDLPKTQTTTPPPPSRTSARPPTPLPSRMAPAHSASPAPRPTASDWISTRFPRQDEILLYVAPNHTAFFLSSFGVGLFLLIGAYSYSQMFLKDPPEESGRPKLHWITKALGAVSVLAIATFGTAFILAPMKLVKSITAVRTEVKAASGRFSSHNVMPWKLRIEVKRAMPFAKADVMELKDPKQVVLDRSVPMVSQNIEFISYNIKDSEWFTERYTRSGTAGLVEDYAAGGGVVGRFNRRLVNIWPGVKREVKRMFLRDQMAYVRVEGNGNFKLDLQNSHMLDGGKVLDKMVGTDGDATPGEGLRAFLTNVLGSGK